MISTFFQCSLVIYSFLKQRARNFISLLPVVPLMFPYIEIPQDEVNKFPDVVMISMCCCESMLVVLLICLHIYFRSSQSKNFGRKHFSNITTVSRKVPDVLLNAKFQIASKGDLRKSRSFSTTLEFHSSAFWMLWVPLQKYLKRMQSMKADFSNVCFTYIYIIYRVTHRFSL